VDPKRERALLRAAERKRLRVLQDTPDDDLDDFPVIDLDDEQVTGEDLDELERARPRCRGDCAAVPRPCPFVGCRYNNYLHLTGAGHEKIVFPYLEPGELENSCALDVAEMGQHTLEEIGDASA